MSAACAIGANRDTSQYLRIIYQRRNKRRALSVMKLAKNAWLCYFTCYNPHELVSHQQQSCPALNIINIEEQYDTKHIHTKHIHK